MWCTTTLALGSSLSLSWCRIARQRESRDSRRLTVLQLPLDRDPASLSLIILFETSFEQKAWTMDVLRDGGRH